MQVTARDSDVLIQVLLYLYINSRKTTWEYKKLTFWFFVGTDEVKYIPSVWASHCDSRTKLICKVKYVMAVELVLLEHLM